MRWEAPGASAQMAVDERLVQEGLPTVRLFRWSRPAISLGLRQPRPAWIDEAVLAAAGVEVVERPTGGGIALHGSDLSCSVTVPSTTGRRLCDIMAGMAQALAAGLARLGVVVRWVGEVRASRRVVYCLAEPSSYALLHGERKLCGLAVRRFHEGLLIQGSLLVRELPEPLRRVLPSPVLRDYQVRAITLEDAAGRRLADQAIDAALVEGWPHAGFSPHAV